jgi:hypothetical protein
MDNESPLHCEQVTEALTFTTLQLPARKRFFHMSGGMRDENNGF